MGLEDSLGLVLRQAALELAAAIDAVVSHRAKLDHVRAVEAGTVDMLGGIEEGRQHADGVEDLERAGLDGRGARLAVRPDLALDKPSGHAVASELRGGEQAGRAGADDQDVVAHQSVSRESGPAGLGVSPVMRSLPPRPRGLSHVFEGTARPAQREATGSCAFRKVRTCSTTLRIVSLDSFHG